ncbi:MAG: DUF1285 domain-containing protein [Geminicoccaceae bacterium]|nr:DUF1285 domain-containing protein [Geminicoccaceae bacterium]
MRSPFDPDALLRDLAASGGGGRFDIEIDRDGRWYYRGSAIERIELVRLFASVLRRDPQGAYWLVTPAEQGRIEVADVPFVLVRMTSEGEGRDRRLLFHSNLDDRTELTAANPLVMRRQPDGKGAAPYLTVRDGLEGRLARSVFYELADLAEEADGEEGVRRTGVWARGRFHPLDLFHEEVEHPPPEPGAS